MLAVLPVPLHTSATPHVKALGPALDVVMPRTGTPVVGYRTASLNVRAEFLFYLDRDLKNVDTIPETPPVVVIGVPE